MPQGEVVYATSIEQVSELLHAVKDKIIVVNYYADWCGPCIKFAPAFATLANEFHETAVFMKVSVEQVPEAAEQQEVHSLPTCVLFFNGHRQADCVGISSYKLKNTIERTLRSVGKATI